MTSTQRKQLRALAHHLDPVVFIGKQGLTEGVMAAVVKALSAHELIKVRFLEGKEEKRELTDKISESTGAEIAGIIGHVAILYKENPDPKKRQIELD